MLMQSIYTPALAGAASLLLLLICYLICSDSSEKEKRREERDRRIKKRREEEEERKKERREERERRRKKKSKEPMKPLARERTWGSEEERPDPTPRYAEPTRAPAVAAAVPTQIIGDFKPERMDPVLFEKLLDDMTSSAFTFEVEGWTTLELKERIDNILQDTGFTLVRSIVEEATSERVEVKIGGWTRQVSTDKGLGVRITLKGVPDRDRAFCHMTVSAEERRIILPTINNLRKKIIS